jgi:hypothetical protein
VTPYRMAYLVSFVELNLIYDVGVWQLDVLV